MALSFKPACLAMIVLGAGAVIAGAPEASVREPDLPETLAGKGTVYHTLSDRETQVVFTSEAPLENIVGKCNQVVGYMVAGPGDNPAALQGARWILPVRTMATGIPLRDDHMMGSEWLDARTYPTIEFELKEVADIESLKSGDGFTTWSVTLVGKMKLHGTEREVSIENATLSFLEESERTRPIASGNLAFLKTNYTVKLSDFGIRHKDVPEKVSDEIRLSQMLRMTDAEPSREPAEAAGGG